MIKVGHIGVFDTNIGDTAATFNIERSWRALHPDTEWFNLNLKSFWGHKNNPNVTKKALGELQEKVDLIIVGGGGLLEYGGYESMGTGWKLPFNEDILKTIYKPIHFHAVGLNIFKGGVPYSAQAKKALQACINMSTTFSVRNDGSYQKLRDWVGLDVSKVQIIPDPGLLYYEDIKLPTRDTVSVGGIQPAFNHSDGINNHRYGSKKNISYLEELFKNHKMYPHTSKDYRDVGQAIIPKKDFEKRLGRKDFLEFVNLYNQVEYVVALRGHGQMITIGMNLPGIYLSTQDKVQDFSLCNGFQDYNVDLTSPTWREELNFKIQELTKPNSQYLKQWYYLRDVNMISWYQQDKEIIKRYIDGV